MAVCPRKFRGRILGPCTKMALIDAVNFEAVYDRRNDLVSEKLGIRGPASPWVPEHAATAAAVLLLKYGYRQNKTRAVGAYRAGPGGAFGKAGQDHVRQLNRVMPEVRQLMRQHHLAAAN